MPAKSSPQHQRVRKNIVRDSAQFRSDTYAQFLHHAYSNLYAWEFLSVTDYDHQGFSPVNHTTVEAQQLKQWCHSKEFAVWIMQEPGVPDWLQQKLLMRLLEE
jgi:hypothetical protein